MEKLGKGEGINNCINRGWTQIDAEEHCKIKPQRTQRKESITKPRKDEITKLYETTDEHR
ncbi:hypothetical protein KAW65_00605 [candidate division WOR-3 bacterium]|nr:hypothetical protein [candidate division WOR-3 bacterium]